MQNLFPYPKFKTLDDLLHATYSFILQEGTKVKGKRGVIKEVINFSATLTNPRSRISNSLDRRLVKSKFAELAWYLSIDPDKEYINPYISAYNDEESENNKILGAYGPKLFDETNEQLSQFNRICEQIKVREGTKQAYIVISNQTDYRVRTGEHSSPPCTIGLHFIVRNDVLNLTTYMRSNDAYFGLPHDLFCFTMLQEMAATKTGIPLGTYTHVCTSMHVYEKHFSRVENYLSEGFFEEVAMPVMESFDDSLIRFIVESFDDSHILNNFKKLTPYWHDYCLFSNRYADSITKEEWLSLFQTQEIKRIAINTITE